MNPSTRRVRLALLVSMLAAASASATTLARMNLEQLAAAADVVARVRCLGSRSGWEAGEIWTFTQFQVEEALQGGAPATLTVQLPGGRAGHLVYAVDGVPRFLPGEEVILFLERRPSGRFMVTSWMQGTFRVHRVRPAAGAKVTQDSSQFPVYDPALRRFRLEGISGMPLAAFRQQLAKAMAAGPRGAKP